MRDFDIEEGSVQTTTDTASAGTEAEAPTHETSAPTPTLTSTTAQESPIFKRGKVVMSPIPETTGETLTGGESSGETLGIVNEVFENVPL